MDGLFSIYRILTNYRFVSACTSDLLKYDANLLSVSPIDADHIKRRIKELQMLRNEMDWASLYPFHVISRPVWSARE